MDLVAHGTVSDADTIRDTAVAQPLLVASALITARALLGDSVPAGAVVAGHSVGEFGAAALAGVLTDAQALTPRHHAWSRYGGGRGRLRAHIHGGGARRRT